MKLPSALGTTSYDNVLEETKNYHRALLSAQPKQVNILACFHRKKKSTFMFFLASEAPSINWLPRMVRKFL